jgi:Na+/H+ antiporter NhaC
MNSPYYSLKQGDVIYVSANKTKEKTSRLDPNMPIYISVASIVVTILALVFKKIIYYKMSAQSQENKYSNEEINVNELIKPYFLKWPWFVICAILAVVISFFR